MTSTINKDFVIDSVTQTNISVAASTGSNASVSIAKSGYTPKGVLQIYKAGAASGYAAPTQWSISGDTLSIYFRNTGTSAITISLTVTILYEKS